MDDEAIDHMKVEGLPDFLSCSNRIAGLSYRSAAIHGLKEVLGARYPSIPNLGSAIEYRAAIG